MLFCGISKQDVFSLKCFQPVWRFTSLPQCVQWLGLLLRNSIVCIICSDSWFYFAFCTFSMQVSVFLSIFRGYNMPLCWKAFGHLCDLIVSRLWAAPCRKSSSKTSHEDTVWLQFSWAWREPRGHRVQSEGFDRNPEPGFTLCSCIPGKLFLLKLSRLKHWQHLKYMSPVGLL